MNDKKGAVGIIGLGIMGGAIARNLVAAGRRVIGYDIDAARCDEAAAAGVTIANGAAVLAREAPVILTSLPKPEALDSTVRAIAAAGVPRRIVAELSTFALADKADAERALREAGHVLL